MQHTPWGRLIELYVEAQTSNPLLVLETPGLSERDRTLLKTLVAHSPEHAVAAWRRERTARAQGSSLRVFAEGRLTPAAGGSMSVLELRGSRAPHSS